MESTTASRPTTRRWPSSGTRPFLRRPASIQKIRRQPGTTWSSIRPRSRRRPARQVMAWSAGSTPATPRSPSCPPYRPTAAAPPTRPSPNRPCKRSSSNMAHGYSPAGPVRRAVVFGGSNIHIFNDQNAGHKVDRKAADAFIAFTCGPEWSVKAFGNWTGSNPGNLQGFKTDGMKQRLEQIKFLEVTSSMLPYGVPFPVIPEATEMMNNTVPNMIHNALTAKITVKQAADHAAEKIKTLIAQRKS